MTNDQIRSFARSMLNVSAISLAFEIAALAICFSIEAICSSSMNTSSSPTSVKSISAGEERRAT